MLLPLICTAFSKGWEWGLFKKIQIPRPRLESPGSISSGICMLIGSPGVSGAGGLGSSGEAKGSQDWESDTVTPSAGRQPADGVDQGWDRHSLCPSRPLPQDLTHLTALCASYTDKPLCTCPAQLLPSKPDGSLNGVLSSLLSFLLQKHMSKTKFQSLDPPTPFCHQAAPYRV